VVAHDIMHESGFPVAHPADGLDGVMRRFGSYRHDIPVLEGGILVGVIRQQDVIDHYNAEIFKTGMAASMTGTMAEGGAASEIPGAPGLALAEIPVPSSFVGRTCGDLDLRRRFGVTLVMVKRREGGGHRIVNEVPDATYRFNQSDELLALGTRENLKALRNLL
jgi:hypothetical protein